MEISHHIKSYVQYWNLLVSVSPELWQLSSSHRMRRIEEVSRLSLILVDFSMKKEFEFISLLVLALLQSSSQHNQQLVQLILSWEDETCPGTVVVFDKHYWTEEHALIDQLVLEYPRPLTLLQSFGNHGLMPDEDSWTETGGSPLETLCNNVILFNRYPADLTTIYRQMMARYPYIGQVLVVTPSPSEQVERFLREFKNHKIMLIINRPWRYLELRNCCWGPDRQIRRVDLPPDSTVRWEEFGFRTSRVTGNRLQEDEQVADPSAY